MGVAFLLLAFSAAHAAEPITEIRFIGNDKTKPQVLLQEMTLAVGDPADPSEVARSRQAIMDLGIFKDVRTELLPAEQGVILQVTIEEKYYVLPLPRLNRNADGDISYGGQLRLDNLMGLNQQFKLTFEKTEPSGGHVDDVEDISLDFNYPRIIGTPYSIAVNGGVTHQTVDAERDGYPGQSYSLSANRFTVSISRLLDTIGPTRGWSVNTGLLWNESDYSYDPGMPRLHQNEERVGWIAGANFYDVRDYLYSRAGEAYGLNFQIGLPDLGSDFYYEHYTFYWRQYNLITQRPHYSLNYQAQVGLSSGFRGNVFALGNASTLRGYERGTIEGTAYVLANVEYLQPLFGHRSVRGLVFVDLGNAYPSNNEIDLFDLKASVGVGLRYVVKSFVNLQLRVDAGYAVDSGDYKIYAGTRDTF